MQTTKVYLVGAGPGDPGLITLKGLDAIKRADCIIYDFLANSRLLEHAREGAETIYVGKKGSSKTIPQEEINSLIIKKAKKGVVVRLKGGDPFIFGRGGEEAEALACRNIPYEVIPGVTSAIAAPAYAGIPLTHREVSSSVTFITGHESSLKKTPGIAWDRLHIGRGTLVFLMAWKNLAFIAKRLIKNGWASGTPVAVIRWGTMTRQRCVTGPLSDIASIVKTSGIKPPIITVVGDVVSLRQGLNWFETRPLFGRRILITRAAEQAGHFARLLEDSGAEPIQFPVIKTVPPKSFSRLDSALKRLSSYDWVVFTSANGVKYFFERLLRIGKDLRELKGVKVCVIGPKTKEAVIQRGIRVDLMPKEYVAESVIRSFGKGNIKGKNFLLPRAEVARDVLPREIKRLGGAMEVCPAYRTIRPSKEARGLKAMLKGSPIDAVTFTSSSTVNNFMGLFTRAEREALLSKAKVACIGPVTAETARAHGLNVDIMPREYTVEGLREALADFYTTKKQRGV